MSVEQWDCIAELALRMIPRTGSGKTWSDRARTTRTGRELGGAFRIFEMSQNDVGRLSPVPDHRFGGVVAESDDDSYDADWLVGRVDRA